MSDLRTSLLLEELLDDSFPEMLERLTHLSISDEDLTRIVNAVIGLRPSATADEIAKAIKVQLQDVTLSVPAGDSSAVVEAIHELKEILDHRFQGLGRAFGASGPSNISSDATRLLGHVTVDNATITTIPQKRENRLDYDTRTDQNPVYVGDADPATATSTATWTVLKLTYDGDNRLTRKQVQTNIAWDGRASGWGA